MQWKTIPLEELYAEPSKNGLSRPKRVRGLGFKMVNMGELFAYDRINDQPMELVPMNEREQREFALQVGDLLFARQSLVAEGAGKCSIVTAISDLTTWESHLIRVRLDQMIADPKFYFYYFSSPQGHSNVQSLVMQVAAAGIRGSELRKLQVPCPPICIQRNIASILSAYDDLIENNTRRIRILEQIIHDIFEEWFISLRFPGYTDRSFASTDFGVLPDEWKRVRLSEAICVNPKITVQKDVAMPYIPMDRLSESDMRIDTTELEYRTKSSGSKFMNFDTLFARITPCLENGKTGYVQFLPDRGVGIGSTEFVVLRSKSLTSEYVYCLSRRPEFRATAQKTMTGASGRQRVQNSFFDEYRILQPTQEILGTFQEVVSPMFNQIKVLADKNARLRSCRDLLLPRLISGELDVSHFEPQVDNVEE